jgi:hypothetical protein
MKKTLLALVVSALATPALALDALPKQPGFSGVVAVGVSGGKVDSNFLAEVINIDLSDTTIYNLDSPDDVKIIVPNFNFNAGYTFENRKTRIYAGTSKVDTLDFNTNMMIAVRHDFDSLGNVELAGLIPGFAEVDVWENPYLTNQGRKSTEATTSGGRFSWDKIFQSNFEFIVSARKKDVDKERSGEGMGLSAPDQKLLDREGDITIVSLGYAFEFGDGKNMLRPNIGYLNYDLDGDAMSQDGYELGLQYTYNAGDFQWLSRGVYQSLDGDKVNPIFHKKNNADVYVLASELRFPNPFGWEKWAVTTGIQWADNDADIEFNESSTLLVVARVARAF